MVTMTKIQHILYIILAVLGTASPTLAQNITGNVYGGGALASVGGSTSVNLYKGSVGSAYGGGLGQVESGTKGQPDYKVAVEALVGGDATVTLDGAKVTGAVYGANNENGTPKGHIKVQVLSTGNRGQANRNTSGSPETFDVPAVYGGGNKAAYIPTNPNDSTEVIITNCENSIAYVYGGGNAAAVPATGVYIHGANAIDFAFAGGNGQPEGQGSGDNPGADVGYLGYYSTGNYEEYGKGTTYIHVFGGTVNNIFGGSNTLGYIRTHANVIIPEVEDGDCDLNVGNVHAGGNKAEMFCGGSMTLACSEGVEAIYAGSNSAHIHGDIVLNITSGTYGSVFGGNNTSGNIYGSITINIDETGCWPIMIDKLYGCGNKAAYSVYGYEVAEPRLPKTSGEKIYNDPVINIVSCTRINNIFGGGKGLTATVYGSPTVNINPITGRYAGKSINPPYILNEDGQRQENADYITIADETCIIGNVYGGGDEAQVYGNTLVNIGTMGQNHHVTGTDTTTLKDVTVTILGNVFGGSKGVSNNPDAGRVTGTTKVMIGE